jgi:hypothetical protein
MTDLTPEFIEKIMQDQLPEGQEMPEPGVRQEEE